MVAKALTIAGSDSGGGAGIQADLKTFSALGVYGASVLTAITAQNTRAVTGVAAIAPDMIRAQIDAVLSDIEINAIKIGMLGDVATIEAVANALADWAGPLVLDPVMVAKSGDPLLAADAVAALSEHLLPRATLLTPNLPEAARLLNAETARTAEEMADQGRALRASGAQAVLMKGGHADGPVCTDLLVTADGTASFSAPRIDTGNTHGTGCTLSSAIAAGLARGLALPDAVAKAHAYLHAAIKAADTLHVGHGHGPVHHFHALWPADG
ncbi:bifunctional hydroxymethylpyrimidine kinase/phosphomethylpyrimidine kinase [Roseovarius aestuariivivens]|uniref:bifunctional hydroxymethylpyrimidine kinase/phosphomethylpyrimidine kinase n=1 Tax=Roseovarius aestuariivivens TaxID=1888910 RepID=UPI0010809870|nr:bifunctional hydroxymethylpyrimidine kinase/phosphomethylpyrimidine kinase [Roseovarius aestuariivivens]